MDRKSNNCATYVTRSSSSRILNSIRLSLGTHATWILINTTKSTIDQSTCGHYNLDIKSQPATHRLVKQIFITLLSTNIYYFQSFFLFQSSSLKIVRGYTLHQVAKSVTTDKGHHPRVLQNFETCRHRQLIVYLHIMMINIIFIY